jgi:hypothetical protein
VTRAIYRLTARRRVRQTLALANKLSVAPSDEPTNLPAVEPTDALAA